MKKINCDHGMTEEAMKYYYDLLDMFTKLQDKIPEIDDLFDLWYCQHGKKHVPKLTIGKRRVTLPAPKKRPGLSTLLGLNGDNGEAL